MTELADANLPTRMVIRRVNHRSLLRVGMSLGWVISFIPALIISSSIAWIAHGIWKTLDGMTPWRPWDPNTKIAGFALPTPEFRPREALNVDSLYQTLAPIGAHPFLGAIAGTILLTIIGGIIVAIIFLLAGIAYNVFALITGGLELEMAPRRQRRSAINTSRTTRRGSQRRQSRLDDDETPLEW